MMAGGYFEAQPGTAEIQDFAKVARSKKIVFGCGL
jgi:hypothetical protein